jgi:YegS/Rv2252/BmrU family lipid kinase
MLKATLIYNPLAGPANLAAPIALVADYWRSLGWRVSVKPTQFAGHATILAQKAALAGHQLVLAGGGDGTLAEVANGLAGTETVLGLLPLGTGNSLAKELQIPRPRQWNQHKLLQAADALAAGRVQQIDLGMRMDKDGGNGRYWVLWAGVGADGYLAHRLEPRPKWSKKLGVVGYALQGLAVIPGAPVFRASVEVDGRVYEDKYVLLVISNCRRYAGGELLLSPQAKLDDGQFEVWLFRGEHIARAFLYLPEILLERHLADGGLTLVNGRHVTIHTDAPIPAQTDGDRAGHSPLTVTIQPGALRLLVLDTAPADLFSRPGKSLDEWLMVNS